MGLGPAVVAVLLSEPGIVLWPRSPSAEVLPGECPGPTRCVAVLYKPVLPHAKFATPTSNKMMSVNTETQNTNLYKGVLSG